MLGTALSGTAAAWVLTMQPAAPAATYSRLGPPTQPPAAIEHLNASGLPHEGSLAPGGIHYHTDSMLGSAAAAWPEQRVGPSAGVAAPGTRPAAGKKAAHGAPAAGVQPSRQLSDQLQLWEPATGRSVSPSDASCRLREVRQNCQAHNQMSHHPPGCAQQLPFGQRALCKETRLLQGDPSADIVRASIHRCCLQLLSML